MDVKKGYKQTEVGVIPEGWDVTTIGNVADTSSGTTPSRSMIERYYNNGTIAWVKTLDLNNSEIYATEENVTQVALNETSLRIYPKGTVLVAMYGGFNQIGRTGLLCNPATINQALTAIRPKTKILISQYLLLVLNYRVDYWKTVASSSRKDPNITGKDVRNFPLAIPPTLAEQQAIAEALSDADALLESLEHLLAKKRQIKQGAMQELLTGRRRLEGFVGEWERNLFGDLATIRKQKIDPGKNDVPLFCVELEHIEQATGRLIGSTETTHTSSIKSVFKEGDVLFGKLRAYLRKYWLADRDGVCTTEIWALMANEG